MNAPSTVWKRPTAPQPCTELDGTPLRDVFTVLAHSAAYTPDQYLHVYTLSALHSWLLRLHSEAEYAGGRIVRNCWRALLNHATRCLGLAPRSHPPLEADFKETILRYCVRLLEQLETLTSWMDEGSTLRKYGRAFCSPDGRWPGGR